MESQVIREARLFEFYARYVWPVHRLFAHRYLTQRCRQCVVSSAYAPLDDNHICHECRTAQVQNQNLHKPRQETMARELDSLLRSVSKTGPWKYDALVLFSGGKDSCYLIHKLQQNYPDLRLLALTIDNSFMSPVARENIAYALSKLTVDHMVYKPKTTTIAKMFAYAFTHLNKHGASGTVDQFDGDLIHDIARNIAVQLKIPLILSGVSPIQVERILKLHTYESPPSIETSKRTHVAGISLRDIFTPDEMNYWWDGSSHPDEKIPRMLYPFYAWGYNEQEMRQQVLDLGLIREGHNSPLITNSELVPLMGLVDIAHLGYSSFEPEFAELARAGKADKKFWRSVFELLEYSAKTGRFISASVDEVLERLNLTRKQVGINS